MISFASACICASVVGVGNSDKSLQDALGNPSWACRNSHSDDDTTHWEGLSKCEGLFVIKAKTGDLN